MISQLQYLVGTNIYVLLKRKIAEEDMSKAVLLPSCRDREGGSRGVYSKMSNPFTHGYFSTSLQMLSTRYLRSLHPTVTFSSRAMMIILLLGIGLNEPQLNFTVAQQFRGDRFQCYQFLFHTRKKSLAIILNIWGVRARGGNNLIVSG